MSAQNKIDPIRERYFRVLEKVEKAGDYLFYGSAILAIAAAVTDQHDHPQLSEAVQLGFVVVVCAMFVIDLVSRFILAPRGADARLKDFWAKAYARPLTTETTTGYYNSQEAIPSRRAAAHALENVLFTKTILGKMLSRFLPFGLGCLAVLLIIWANRSASLSLVATVTQVVLAEQVFVRGARMIWLKLRCDRLFADLEQLFLANQPDDVFAALASEYITKYEASKALANITLSDAIFENINLTLTAEWEQMKPRLGIS